MTNDRPMTAGDRFEKFLERRWPFVILAMFALGWFRTEIVDAFYWVLGWFLFR